MGLRLSCLYAVLSVMVLFYAFYFMDRCLMCLDRDVAMLLITLPSSYVYQQIADVLVIPVGNKTSLGFLIPVVLMNSVFFYIVGATIEWIFLKRPKPERFRDHRKPIR